MSAIQRLQHDIYNLEADLEDLRSELGEDNVAHNKIQALEDAIKDLLDTLPEVEIWTDLGRAADRVRSALNALPEQLCC